jgi:hypothetical protein
MDNYGAHRIAQGEALVCAPPRYHVHLTPTSASWLNQVERFFGLHQFNKLTGAQIVSDGQHGHIHLAIRVGPQATLHP